MFDKKIIEFSSPVSELLVHPVPAKKIVPDWFKDLKNYTDKFNLMEPTIKKCVPVLDSLTSGYIILNPLEIVFWEENGNIHWEYPNSLGNSQVFDAGLGIELHRRQQIHKDFIREEEYKQPFKYLNPWRIKTPENYSCLFTNPLNRQDDSIRLIDGIVDTDKYPNVINFPFLLKKLKKNEAFILKKNYPIALVFPFLRNKWQMTVKKNTKKENDKNYEKYFKLFTLMKDNYKKLIWSKKEYD